MHKIGFHTTTSILNNLYVDSPPRIRENKTEMSAHLGDDRWQEFSSLLATEIADELVLAELRFHLKHAATKTHRH